MPKKKPAIKKQLVSNASSGMEKAMQDINSVIIYDIHGNVVHVGSWVKTDKPSKEELDSYETINDWNADLIEEDMGSANGSLYDPDYNPGEPPANEVLTRKKRLK